MPRRRRIRDKGVPHGARIGIASPEQGDTTSQRRWQASIVLHPTPLGPASTKRRVIRAHEKHAMDNASSTPTQDGNNPPTLGDRFHALPTELRAHIFSFLVVQPVKWQMPHQPTCSVRWLGPIPAYTRLMSRSDLVIPCAKCADPYAGDHRHSLDKPAWVHPWRSPWAPPQRNPYLCTTCYDARWRPRPFPADPGRVMSCCCGRRRYLHVLLVCRRWYREAAAVMYAGNVWAFETPATLAAFVENLDPRWRRLVTKVSLLMACWFESPGEAEVAWADSKLGQAWQALRRLEALTELEMDEELLRSERAVKGMVRMGLRGLRQMKWVERGNFEEDYSTNGVIWTTWYERKTLQGGFAEEMARVIKGERRKWTKRPSDIEETVRRVREQWAAAHPPSWSR